jgi:hypothetical protein
MHATPIFKSYPQCLFLTSLCTPPSSSSRTPTRINCLLSMLQTRCSGFQSGADGRTDVQRSTHTCGPESSLLSPATPVHSYVSAASLVLNTASTYLDTANKYFPDFDTVSMYVLCRRGCQHPDTHDPTLKPRGSTLETLSCDTYSKRTGKIFKI